MGFFSYKESDFTSSDGFGEIFAVYAKSPVPSRRHIPPLLISPFPLFLLTS